MRARLDGRFFEPFVFDVNIAVDDPRPIDRLTLRPVLHWAGFASPTIAAVPVAFHIAEKLHAYVRIYSNSIEHIEFESEAGMFCAYGSDRRSLEDLGGLMAAVVHDPDGLSAALRMAEEQGFEFDD